MLAEPTEVGLKKKAQAVIIATGSEVQLALKAQELLAGRKIAVRVVSMPSTTTFDKQGEAYKSAVLPAGVPRVAVELARRSRQRDDRAHRLRHVQQARRATRRETRSGWEGERQRAARRVRRQLGQRVQHAVQLGRRDPVRRAHGELGARAEAEHDHDRVHVERRREQRRHAFCSGTLIDDDLVLTVNSGTPGAEEAAVAQRGIFHRIHHRGIGAT